MQKNYNDCLDSQIRLKNDIHTKFGTMTNSEKLLNIKDLKSYSSSNATLTAMIPGIHNIASIGTRPTYRVGRAIVNSISVTPVISNGKSFEMRRKSQDFDAMTDRKSVV